jgi:hypothetical protein
MATLEAEGHITADHALELAREVGVDLGAWYVRALEASAEAGDPADRGALARLLWERQRTTGRSDVRAEWRRVADALDLADTA